MGRGAAGTGGGEAPSHKAIAQAKLERAERQSHAVPITRVDLNGDGVVETVAYDTNGDGIADAFDTVCGPHRTAPHPTPPHHTTG